MCSRIPRAHSDIVPRNRDPSAHSPTAFLPPAPPGLSHTSLCSAVGGEGAPSPSQKRGDSQRWSCGRPQGLPGGGNDREAEPSGWGRLDPQQRCVRVDSALRALNPQSPARCMVQHLCSEALSSSGSRHRQAGTLTPRRSSPSNLTLS